MSLEDLGRRAVACKHFYWMPGMSLSNGRTIGTWKDGEVCGSSDTSPPYDGAVYPMLDDPATIGCLLHLVRERWQLPLRSPEYWPADGAEHEYWSMEMYDEYICGDTEAEALVVALEAAP